MEKILTNISRLQNMEAKTENVIIFHEFWATFQPSLELHPSLQTYNRNF